jgi:secondary thiamine-phosphate synthase enzyme
MTWIQKTLHLPAHTRGLHLITGEVTAALPELENIAVGLLHVFLQHTSASLTINENADRDVPVDLEASLSAIAPEDFPYRHTVEGPDDMPAHVKTSLLGASLTIPVAKGELCLGTWQGIYLCEHRRHGGRRKLVLTVWGEKKSEWSFPTDFD